ncbi:MAG: phosphotransferase [Alphaproteobacteria bacterium]|nr:phosphotransferase [Alphaproteobacteria bacterium]
MQPQKQDKQTEADTETADRRRALREGFIAAQGWQDVTLEELQADASFRRYYRLQGASKPLLLMQDPPDRPPVPPYVMVEPFVKIARHLRLMGLHAPEIHAEDLQNGLLLIEDFGEKTYTRLLNDGEDAKELFGIAVDALIHLHRHADRNNIQLPAYDEKLMLDEAMLLPDWYYPALTGDKPTDGMKESYKSVWRELFAKLPQDQQTLVLRDYHVDNLMLTPGAGIWRCGLLDFQDAVLGQFSYDLMSLLEDARRAMAPELKQHLYDRYMAGMEGRVDKEGFDYAFRVLAAQRHAKVLGIFVRLFARDGKERYLQFIPHVHGLFMQSLEDPALKPLKDWFAAQGIDIAAPLDIKK